MKRDFPPSRLTGKRSKTVENGDAHRTCRVPESAGRVPPRRPHRPGTSRRVPPTLGRLGCRWHKDFRPESQNPARPPVALGGENTHGRPEELDPIDETCSSEKI